MPDTVDTIHYLRLKNPTTFHRLDLQVEWTVKDCTQWAH